MVNYSQTARIGVVNSSGEPMLSIDVNNLHDNDIVKDSIESSSPKAGLKVISLANANGLPLDTQYTTWKEAKNGGHINTTVDHNTQKLEYDGLVATGTMPASGEFLLTENSTPPIIQAGKFYNGYQSEGRFGGKFVAWNMKEKGKQLRTEWMPENEYLQCIKEEKLKNERALLGDPHYFEGRGGYSKAFRRR